MATISVEESCGNSPRKQFLSDFYVAIAARDEETIRSMLTDDVQLTIVGEETLDGRDGVVDAMGRAIDGVSEVTVENIITHGDTAAVNGVMSADAGNSRAFCDVYTFEGHSKNANIESIDSYVIETA